MFTNKWYNIQLRKDYVDRVCRANDKPPGEITPDSGTDGGAGGSGNPNPGDEGGPNVNVFIPNIQDEEYIYGYEKKPGTTIGGFPNLDINFGWNVNVSKTTSYINSLNALNSGTHWYVKYPYSLADFELRKIKPGYEDRPFDANGFEKVATGYRKFTSQISNTTNEIYYTAIEKIILRQNLVLLGSNSDTFRSSMSFVKDYNGDEKRFVTGKITKWYAYDSTTGVAFNQQKAAAGENWDIIEFSLDDCPFYDKQKKKFIVDDFEISGIDFVDRYIKRNVWLYPETTTISSLPTLEYYKWNKVDTALRFDETNTDTSSYDITLQNPEIQSGHGNLYNSATNTLRFWYPDLGDELNPSFIKKGDELKIPIEPRLLGETYYYLTLINPNRNYNNGVTNITDKPIYHIIDEVVKKPTFLTVTLSTKITDVPQPPKRQNLNTIELSKNNYYNSDEFYNWTDTPQLGIDDYNNNGNDYFAWFKTPKWVPYVPIKPFNNSKSYEPSIKFGYSYEEPYNATTNPDSVGTVTGQSISIDKYKVTLKGQFWLKQLDYYENAIAIPGDVPVSMGFLIRKSGETQFTITDSNQVTEISDTGGYGLGGYWLNDISTPIPEIETLDPKNYAKILPIDQGGTDNDRVINITTSFEVGTYINWEYRIFITRKDGKTFYADPDTYTGVAIPAVNYTKNKNFLIQTGGIKLTEWIDPGKKDVGFWYQIYNSWKQVTNQNRISPYLTVKIYDGIGLPNNNNIVNMEYPIHYYFNYVFNIDKNFQFRTIVENYYNTSNQSGKPSIEFKTPWGEKIMMPAPFIGLTQIPDALKRLNIYSYSNINGYTDNLVEKPKKFISSKTNPQNPVTYVADTSFGAQNDIMESGLCHLSVSENDWSIQGSAVWNIMPQDTPGIVKSDLVPVVPYFHNGIPYAGRGWHFLTKEGKFVWFDSLYTGDDKYNCFPIGGDTNDYFSGKSSDIAFLRNNFISTYVPYQLFNLNFEYTNESTSKISMYMGGELPYKTDGLKTDIDDLISKGLVKKIGTLEASVGKNQKCEFIGLVGNQYLFFVADPILDFDDDTNFSTDKKTILVKSSYKLTSQETPTIGTYSIIEIGNFGVSGTYNKENNLIQYTQTNNNNYQTNIKNAAYSIKLGTGNNVFAENINSTVIVNTKAGNGTIHSGIWENGVWNNGWRSDTTTREFIRVGQYYSYDKDRTWRMSIIGKESSIAYFEVGNIVAISNVVAIDINEERKLLKSEYRIISKTSDSIVVEFDTDFPMRRIEKDSSDHRIFVTKNIWLNGVFLNGYFKGIWNNGLFSGFPMITKMDSTHWIDGIFNGGHFTSKKLRFSSEGTGIATSYIVDGKERMAISFKDAHRFEKDDIISMTYSTTTSTGVLGSTIVLEVPDTKKIVTGIGWRTELVDIISITLNTSISDGLVQNFEFHANNVSTVTSLDTLISERVFSYNSWMDVNYSNKSAINIGRPQTLLNQHDKAYSENNLYGYPSNDVLSSRSTFRDSYSKTVRSYRLGKKYKIYKDYVGESSGFENYFDPTDTKQGEETFNEQGWAWSKSSETSINIKSSDALKTTDNKLLLEVSDDNPYVDFIDINVSSVTITGPVEERANSNFIGFKVVSVEAKITNKITESGVYKLTTDSGMFSSTNGNNWEIDEDMIPNNLDKKFYISFTQSSLLKFSRTPEPTTQGIPGQGKELLVNALGNGGILYIKEGKNVEGDNVDPVPKQRYTMVEFELINYSGDPDLKGEYIDEIGKLPPIHFNNVNRVFRKTPKGVLSLSATYLPIYKNINHVSTFGNRKQEFFFNKRNILMSFTGYGKLGGEYSEYTIDNLKLYEVDMVPFFQYFKNPIGKTGNINTSVQIPHTGTSPDLIEPGDKVIDATTENEVVNLFVSKLVSYNRQIPSVVNWRRDYAVYGPQTSESYTDPRLY
jgi:hypothetical protein